MGLLPGIFSSLGVREALVVGVVAEPVAAGEVAADTVEDVVVVGAVVAVVVAAVVTEDVVVVGVVVIVVIVAVVSGEVEEAVVGVEAKDEVEAVEIVVVVEVEVGIKAKDKGDGKESEKTERTASSRKSGRMEEE